MKALKIWSLCLGVLLIACQAPRPTPAPLLAAASVTPSSTSNLSLTLVATSTSTPAPTLKPSPTSTPISLPTGLANPTVTLSALSTPTSSPTPVVPQRGDLILKIVDEGTVAYKIYRAGQILPSSQEFFEAHYWEPNVGQVIDAEGKVRFRFFLELVNERREVKLTSFTGDGPPKHIMNSGGRTMTFVPEVLAVNEWGYVAAMRADKGRRIELYFGEALDDHHQGPAKQLPPPWLREIRRIYWDVNDDLLLIAVTEDGLALVRVTPGARRTLPLEKRAESHAARWILSEFLMRHNKSLVREYRVLWLGVLAVAVVR